MKFRPGDEVIVNGTQAVIRSWPADDSGPFNYEMAAPGGGRTSAVGWINPDMGLEPAHGGYDVRLVRRPEPFARVQSLQAGKTAQLQAAVADAVLAEQAWLDSIDYAGTDFTDVEHADDVYVERDRLAETATDDEWLAFISRNDSVGRNE